MFARTTVRSAKLGIEGLASKANLTGANVLVRLDLNVPLSKDDGKTITNDKRLRAVVPTLEFLKAQGAKTVIATHIGRPKEAPFSDSMKTSVVTERLSELIDVDVQYCDETVGAKAKAATAAMPNGGVELRYPLLPHRSHAMAAAAMAAAARAMAARAMT